MLVTGGAGFLGVPLCRRLEATGAYDVVVPRRRDFDLTDAEQVRNLFEQARPDLVIHLAAEVGGIGANRDTPGRFIYANLAMGVNVIEQARRSGVRKFVQVGTVCSYPKHTPVPFREEDLWSGYPEVTNAPYAIAKKALLVMLQAYREQYGLNGIYLLPVNLYGPGDNFDPRTSHVIPALIRKCVAARREGATRVSCWGTGRPSREFLFVEDCAEAIVRAAELYDSPEPVNIGSGYELTVADLAEMIARVSGFEGDLIWDADQPDGQARRRVDTERARAGFGFTASMGLEEGLRRTLDWYLAHQEPRFAQARALQEIRPKAHSLGGPSTTGAERRR